MKALQKRNMLALLPDPAPESVGMLLAVVFPKSASNSYPLAVSIARGAPKYSEGILGDKVFHLAIFGRNREGAQRAIMLLNHVVQWRGCEIYGKGRPLRSAYEIFGVLQCYLEALSCSDYRSHCIAAVQDPLREKPMPTGGVWISFSVDDGIKTKKSTPIIKTVEEYSFPCSKLLRNFEFKFQFAHPSSPGDQIQAAAVHRNVDLCPLFEPGDFRKLGTRMVNLK